MSECMSAWVTRVWRRRCKHENRPIALIIKQYTVISQEDVSNPPLPPRGDEEEEVVPPQPRVSYAWEGGWVIPEYGG